MPYYWLNVDSTRVTMHRSSCEYIVTWAGREKVEGGWRPFETIEEGEAFTSRSIHFCQRCFAASET